ncbi:sulfite exporter TauE/SafE family protein [Microbaculum marinisediminis]|uniref:Probable membrane transporter protein n=1 Tax=Microbaculum marinisediminis TaxID=2931392 RepID=A0AAW5QRG8_9HYPH|nr:sulfite exporter TauE/SafE family protein [Microbaculum sp. A6E488]MCT8970457.1 sulfite exporter TauE/SafE family protein [Microbaculum sp. A6E488]
MLDTTTLVIAIALAYLGGGIIKGVIGVGLPTISIGVLSLFIAPGQAAAYMVIPAYVTNIWQAWHGPYLRALLKRFWSLYLALFAGSWITAGILANESSGLAAGILGILLSIYAVFGLTNPRIHISKRAETWLSPLVGLTMGMVVGATGIFTMPSMPYMQALDLDRDEFVQSIGLLFTFATVTLTSILLVHGLLPTLTLGMSAMAVVPAIIGMVLGRKLRGRIDPPLFKRIFLVGMLLIGLNLAARSFLY